jgi:hypothetical protein
MNEPAILLFVREWCPSAGWGRDYVRPAYHRCAATPSDPDSVPAWTNLCIMLGDTRAAPLCLIVGLHARSLLPELVEDRHLQAQIDLCLWTLDLARSDRRALPLRSLGDPKVLHRDDAQLAAWLAHELAPFDHDLERGALATLRLAALRTGVIQGPAMPTVAQLLDAEAWTIVGPLPGGRKEGRR